MGTGWTCRLVDLSLPVESTPWTTPVTVMQNGERESGNESECHPGDHPHFHRPPFRAGALEGRQCDGAGLLAATSSWNILLSRVAF